LKSCGVMLLAILRRFLAELGVLNTPAVIMEGERRRRDLGVVGLCGCGVVGAGVEGVEGEGRVA